MNVTVTKIDIAPHFWIFHPLGTGILIMYNSRKHELKFLNEATGLDIKREIVKPYKNIVEFKKEGLNLYNTLINDNISLGMNYYDDPTIIDTAEGGVAVDLDVIKN